MGRFVDRAEAQAKMIPSLFQERIIPVFGDNRRMRIGLLGGSFNPAHQGHLQLARKALHFLQLDQVWLMVSPGNPLKMGRDMASFERRLATAQDLVAQSDCRNQILVTDIEQRLGQNYSVRTIELLKKRFPHARFVWLMGADGLAQFDRWKEWKKIARLLPVIVFPRPGQIAQALRGRAASIMRHHRFRPRQARLLLQEGTGWSFLPARQNALSATLLRKAGLFVIGDQEATSL